MLRNPIGQYVKNEQTSPTEYRNIEFIYYIFQQLRCLIWSIVVSVGLDVVVRFACIASIKLSAIKPYLAAWLLTNSSLQITWCLGRDDYRSAYMMHLLFFCRVDIMFGYLAKV